MDNNDTMHPSMIKLRSMEGHEFFVDRRCAMVSGTIKSMLSGTPISCYLSVGIYSICKSICFIIIVPA